MKKSLVLAAALLAGTAAADDHTDSLIRKLGSTHYPTRDAAHKALAKKTDQDTQDQLVEAMKSPDMEVARRAAEILEPYLAKQKEKAIDDRIQKTRADVQGKYPFIDTAGFDWNLQQTYMGKAKGTMTAPDWSKYRHAAQLLIEDCIRQDHPIDDLVERMKTGELNWLENHNRYANPKVPPTWK